MPLLRSFRQFVTGYYKDLAPTEQAILTALHPDNLIAPIDIDHLAGDRGGSITG